MPTLGDVPTMAQRFFTIGECRFPTFNVYVSGYTECLCGLLLLAGLGSRIITIPLIINFCVAYLTASHDTLVNIFNKPDDFVSRCGISFPAGIADCVYLRPRSIFPRLGHRLDLPEEEGGGCEIVHAQVLF